MRYILQTERLRLREFTIDDADFIVHLLNTEGWLQFIGDRNVRNHEQAVAYLKNGPLKSYAENGFGLYLVETRDQRIAIGMCGILKRPTLETPDIGFAFLPDYSGIGYAIEIATATLAYAAHVLKIPSISAITKPDNSRSIRLLEKIGMTSRGTMEFNGQDEPLRIYGADLLR